MRWLLALSTICGALVLADVVEARITCGCTSMAGFSSADAGECKVLENKKPSCHLNWYDVRDVSQEVADAYEETRHIVRLHLERGNFQHLGDMDSSEESLRKNDDFLNVIEQNDIKPTSVHFALGYLGYTDPQEYELEPLLQSISLLLSINVQLATNSQAVQTFLVLIDQNAELMHARISRGENAGQPETLELPDIDTQGAVIDYSGVGCVDLRFSGVSWVSGLTTMLLKSRKSLPGRVRC